MQPVIGIFSICERKKVVEEFLFREPLKTTTKAVDVFNIVKEFFLNHKMSLDMVGSLCTDGAPAILGNKSGFASLVTKDSSHYSHILYVSSPRSCSQVIARKTEKCVINCCECSQLHQRTCLESSSV